MISVKSVNSTVATLVLSIAIASQAALACSPEIKLDEVSGTMTSHSDLALALAELNGSQSVADASN